MTFELHPQLAADTRPVTSLALNEVLLIDDSRYLWCVLVPRLPGLRDLHDVPPEHKARMHKEIDRVSTVIQDIAGAHKMNVAALGNMVEQLHVHVIARQPDDEAWPGPVWGKGQARPYGDGEALALRRRLRDALRD